MTHSRTEFVFSLRKEHDGGGGDGDHDDYIKRKKSFY
jgi:hypothetical protein